MVLDVRDGRGGGVGGDEERLFHGCYWAMKILTFLLRRLIRVSCIVVLQVHKNGKELRVF